MKKIGVTLAILTLSGYMLTVGLFQAVDAASTRVREAQVLFSGAGHDHSGGANGNPDLIVETVTATGTIEANAFVGDGSGLTSVDDTTKVLKAGDTMTGLLTINFSTAGTSLNINNATAVGNGINSSVTTGIGVYGKASSNGRGVVGEAASNGDGVYGYNLSTGHGVLGLNTSSGVAVQGNQSGTGKAGYFQNTNAANTNAALTGKTVGTSTTSYGVYGEAIAGSTDTSSGVAGFTSGYGYGVYGKNDNATQGKAGYFENTNAANNRAALSGVTAGSGNTSYGVYGEATGTGRGVFGLSDTAGIGYGVYGTQNGAGAGVTGLCTGDGHGVFGWNTSAGTGKAGYFNINNAANTDAALTGRTIGTSATSYGVHAHIVGNGDGAGFYSTNAGSGGLLYAGNHQGSGGYLVRLQNGGSNAFTVDKVGNMWASGSLTIDSALTMDDMLTIAESATPSTPAGNSAAIWLDGASHNLMIMWDDGATSTISVHP